MEKIDFTKIQPSFPPQEDNELSFQFYMSSVERLVKAIIPSDLFPEQSYIEKEDVGAYYLKLQRLLPLLDWSVGDKTPTSVSVTLLCSADYTHGAGRFVCDMCSRWLIPGKQLPIVVVRSLNFTFQAYPNQKFFINELIIDIQHETDLELIRGNLPLLSQEIRQNVSAVRHARHVISTKPLSLEQKMKMVEDNIESLLDRPSKEFEPNIFDQMHHLFLKASAEQKIAQIKEQMSSLHQLKPKVFDRDIFDEIRHFILLFRDFFCRRS